MRTLVVRLGALGDAVLTLPALAHLVTQGDEVTVLGVPASWGFLPETTSIRIENVEAPRWWGLFSGEEVEAARGFDRAIIMLGIRTVTAALSRAGISTLHIPPMRPGESGEHAASRLLQGVGGSSPDPAEVRALIAPDPGGNSYDLVLHPGSGGRLKRWPAARFADLGRRSSDPLVLLGPAEDDLAPAFDDVRVARNWPLRRVVATLAVARVFVGNDSGVSHLASWLCPTLALFGPTDPEVWAPAGPQARVLAAPAGDLAKLSVEDVARHISA